MGKLIDDLTFRAVCEISRGDGDIDGPIKSALHDLDDARETLAREVKERAHSRMKKWKGRCRYFRDRAYRAEAATQFRLEAQTREAEEARFYRYLRDEAGQLPDDHDGPMICSGLGDNFEFLRGEECDIALREAIEASHR